MPRKKFKPPTYSETYDCIFDRKTGEILATETRWVDEGVKSTHPSVSRELLRSIAEDSGRKPSDLDVLRTQRPAQDLVRVDISERKLITVKEGRKARAGAPRKIPKP